VLIEDDVQVHQWTLFDIFADLVCTYDVHHLMLGPVTASGIWSYTGAVALRGPHIFREYRRTREPQDTPGTVTMVTRVAVAAAGGLHAGFRGRGHAHGEWTNRLFRLFPSGFSSPMWHLAVDHLLEYVTRPPIRSATNSLYIAANRELREHLLNSPTRLPNMHYCLGECEESCRCGSDASRRGGQLRCENAGCEPDMGQRR
jgi:hypothetical protein